MTKHPQDPQRVPACSLATGPTKGWEGCPPGPAAHEAGPGGLGGLGATQRGHLSPNPKKLHAKASSFLRWPSVQGARASELRKYLGHIMVPQEDGQKCRVAGTRVSVSCRRPTLTASALIWHWTPPPSCQRGPEPQGKLVMPPTLPSPPAHEGRLARSSFYLDLPVLPDLVDLDLLSVGQGVVQGLWGRLLQLTGGWRRAHHGLCREVHTGLRDQPRLSPPLPSPAAQGGRGSPPSWTWQLLDVQRHEQQLFTRQRSLTCGQR